MPRRGQLRLLAMLRKTAAAFVKDLRTPNVPPSAIRGALAAIESLTAELLRRVEARGAPTVVSFYGAPRFASEADSPDWDVLARAGLRNIVGFDWDREPSDGKWKPSRKTPPHVLWLLQAALEEMAAPDGSHGAPPDGADDIPGPEHRAAVGIGNILAGLRTLAQAAKAARATVQADIARGRGGSKHAGRPAEQRLFDRLFGIYEEMRRRFPDSGNPPGVSINPVSGMAGGPLPRFIRACLAPLEPRHIFARPFTDGAIRERYRRWRAHKSKIGIR